MSNQIAGKRIIQVKPIEIQIPHAPEDEAELESAYTGVADKIRLAEETLEDLRSKKQALLAETEEEIAAAKSDWETEKQTYIDTAKQEGYAEGMQLGKDEGLSSYKMLIEQANETIAAAQADYQATLEKSEDTIIELAIATAEKILQQQITESPESFRSVVTAAIQEIADQSAITINVNPAHYEMLLQQKDELQRLLNRETTFSIYMDSGLPENGCIIEHPFGQIDASIDTQLTQIRDILLELALEKRQ